MTDEELVTLAKKYRRRSVLFTAFITLSLVVVSLSVDRVLTGSWETSIVALAAAIGLYIVWELIIRIPLFVVDEREVFLTGKSPEQVRSEFVSSDPPPVMLTRVGADTVERFENGTKYTRTGLLRTTETGYYEAVERSDGVIEVYHQPTAEEPAVTVKIAVRSDGTEVVFDTFRLQVTLGRLLGVKIINGSLYRRAMEVQGYELVDARRRYSLFE